MLLLLLSPITNIKFIIILSSIRAYSFFNVLILEIDEIENKEFINALFLMGLKRYQIIRKHILPILTIPIGIFFLETIIWFMVIEFALSFINVIKIYQYPSIGTMLHHFIQNEHYKESYLIIILLYLFIFELNYITTNIKIKFEILFRKEN
jgi:ABC-type dipeptide/oligopeptide/nickel transport system permease subunit